jgi:hypothetical protein
MVALWIPKLRGSYFPGFLELRRWLEKELAAAISGRVRPRYLDALNR